VSKSNYIGIDLFAGAGGLSYGLSRAGFRMKLGIEINPYYAFTLAMNNNDMKVITADIRKTDPLEVIKGAGIMNSDLSIIAGGPPCQGFSESNRRTRCLDNPLNNLYLEFFRFIKKLHPNFFLLENVQGLRTLHQGIVLYDILRLGEKYGYKIKWGVTNATDYGIPQRRKRIIVLGAQNEIIDPFKSMRKNSVTVRRAIDDLPILDNGNNIDLCSYSRYDNLSEFQKEMRKNNGEKVVNNLVTKNNTIVLERYKHVPEGGTWADIPQHLMTNYKNLSKCHRWIYHRLKWDMPSISVSNFRKNMLIHPTQNRGLSVREASRLQSFPDDYVFYGPLGSQQQQVANAVPPLLSENIGKNIISSI
jgi:DNA (cytosine-5)-methyltransferase 1